jgi:hypothetical protein
VGGRERQQWAAWAHAGYTNGMHRVFFEPIHVLHVPLSLPPFPRPLSPCPPASLTHPPWHTSVSRLHRLHRLCPHLRRQGKYKPRKKKAKKDKTPQQPKAEM